MEPITVSYMLVTFISIFTIVNPLGAIPTFLMHAATWKPEQLQQNARRASTAMVIVLIVFALTGTYIFEIMNITMPAFRIAGGIILFSVAFQMAKGANLRRKLLPEEVQDAEQKEDITIIPLAIPLLSGPGAIGTVIMLMSHKGNPVVNGAIVICSIIATGIATYIIFWNAKHLLRLLGPSGVRIMTRIFGLMLAAIAVQFIINGVAAISPFLSQALVK